jgi:hypothetical protein
MFVNCKTLPEIQANKYFTLKYNQYKYKEKVINSIQPIIAKTNDSIGKFMATHSTRFDFFINKYVDGHTLHSLYPDTLQIEKYFTKKINEKKFLADLKKLLLINQQKDSISTDEMMLIASRFFYVNRKGDRYGIKVCSQLNGTNQLESKENTKILEAIIFEAIFTEILNKSQEKPEFLTNLSSNFSKIITENKESMSADSLEIYARNYIYKKMYMDDHLKNYLIRFFKQNKNNLPIVLKQSATNQPNHY